MVDSLKEKLHFYWQQFQTFHAASPLKSYLAIATGIILLVGLAASVTLALNQAYNASHASGTITLQVDATPHIDISKKTITFHVAMIPSGNPPPNVAAAKLHVLVHSTLLPLTIGQASGLVFPQVTLHDPHVFPLESDAPSFPPFSNINPVTSPINPPSGCYYTYSFCPHICIQNHCLACPSPQLICTTPTPTITGIPTSQPCNAFDAHACPVGYFCNYYSGNGTGNCVPNGTVPNPSCPSCYQQPAGKVNAQGTGPLYYSVGDQYIKTVNSKVILADITFHLNFSDKASLTQQDIDAYAQVLRNNFSVTISFAEDSQLYVLNPQGNPRQPFVKAPFIAQPATFSWDSIFPSPTPVIRCRGNTVSPVPCPTGYTCKVNPGPAGDIGGICISTNSGATKFQMYILNHDTGKGIDGVTVQVADTSPDGSVNSYTKTSQGGGAIVLDTVVGNTITMTVLSTNPSSASFVPQTITSLVYDYNNTAKPGCGELNNSCIVFGYGFPKTAPTVTLPMLLACIDLNKPMADPNSNYNSAACKAYPNRADADLNKDGKIDGVDLNIFYRSQ